MALSVEASGPSQVPNSHLRAIICGGMTQLERDIKVDDDDGDLLPLPRTELDSHANMVLLGKHSLYLTAFLEINVKWFLLTLVLAR